MLEEPLIDEALHAYAAGHADGATGRTDAGRVEDPETGPDYRVGLADGSVLAFQAELLAQVRRLLGDPPG